MECTCLEHFRVLFLSLAFFDNDNKQVRLEGQKMLSQFYTQTQWD